MNKFTVKLEVPEDSIVSAFICACEGGSNYWCKELTPKGKGDAYKAMLKGFTLVEIAEKGETKKHVVGPTKIQRAVKLMAEKHFKHLSDLISGHDDADTGDIFLQLCVFGEVKYG